MEPIVETERMVVDPYVIEVEGETEIGRCPVRFEGSQIRELRKGQPEIGCREDHNQSIVNCMDSVIGILELVVAQSSVHKYEGLKKGGGEDEWIEHLDVFQYSLFNSDLCVTLSIFLSWNNREYV